MLSVSLPWTCMCGACMCVCVRTSCHVWLRLMQSSGQKAITPVPQEDAFLPSPPPLSPPPQQFPSSSAQLSLFSFSGFTSPAVYQPTTTPLSQPPQPPHPHPPIVRLHIGLLFCGTAERLLLNLMNLPSQHHASLPPSLTHSLNSVVLRV